MRSKRVSFRLIWPLYEEFEKVAKAEGYQDVSACLQALVFTAVQDHRRRTWVPELFNEKPTKQDKLVDQILKWPQHIDEMIERFYGRWMKGDKGET